MNMNETLRKFSIFIGFGLLFVSMFWSQSGFNFDLVGDGGGTSFAVFIGWFLAISVTVVQFVFSTNFKELNASLIFFGVIAYAYSIYTNYLGISHFQGGDGNVYGAWSLALVLDGVPEPLIAWGLRQSLQGDWIGNLIKSLSSSSYSQKEPKTENSAYGRLPKKNQVPSSVTPQHVMRIPGAPQQYRTKGQNPTKAREPFGDWTEEDLPNFIHKSGRYKK